MKYAHKSSLKRHMNKHSNEPSFTCGICHQYFNTKEQLQSHRTKYHGNRYLCNDCGKDSKTKSNLDNHLAQVHKKLQENAQHFICPFEGCGKAFLRKLPYQFHLNKHTGVKPYTCHNCPRKFISQYRKRQHENICLGIIEIKCIRCGTKVTDKQS